MEKKHILRKRFQYVLKLKSTNDKVQYNLSYFRYVLSASLKQMLRKQSLKVSKLANAMVRENIISIYIRYIYWPVVSYLKTKV